MREDVTAVDTGTDEDDVESERTFERANTAIEGERGARDD